MNRHGTTIRALKILLPVVLWTLAQAAAGEPEELEARADALIATHGHADEGRDLDAACRGLEEARELYARLGDPQGQIEALLELALVYREAEKRDDLTATYHRLLPRP